MLGVDVIAWLQDTLPWLTPIMAVLTHLGDVELYVVVLAAVHWSLSPRWAVRVGVLLLVSAGVNAALKLAAGAPRPYWVAGDVTAHAAEPTYGFPSGHAQNAAAVWGRAGVASHRRAGWLAAGALIVLIGVSRWQLGAHTPVDTLGGLAVGGALLAAAVALEPRVEPWLARRGAGTQLLVAVAVSLGVLAAAAVAQLSPWAGPALPTWIEQARAAAPATPLDPTSPVPAVRAAGALLGLGAGLVLAGRRGGFDAAGPVTRRVLRCGVGLLGVAALSVGLGRLLPDGGSLAALALLYGRFTLLGLWVSGLAPLAFSGLGLASWSQRPPGASARPR